MSNTLETIPSDALVTTTGGTWTPVQRQLWQMSHSIKDAISSVTAQQNNGLNGMMPLLAVLALRGR
jgi:hypothetical protein